MSENNSTSVLISNARWTAVAQAVNGSIRYAKGGLESAEFHCQACGRTTVAYDRNTGRTPSFSSHMSGGAFRCECGAQRRFVFRDL